MDRFRFYDGLEIQTRPIFYWSSCRTTMDGGVRAAAVVHERGRGLAGLGCGRSGMQPHMRRPYPSALRTAGCPVAANY